MCLCRVTSRVSSSNRSPHITVFWHIVNQEFSNDVTRSAVYIIPSVFAVISLFAHVCSTIMWLLPSFCVNLYPSWHMVTSLSTRRCVPRPTQGSLCKLVIVISQCIYITVIMSIKVCWLYAVFFSVFYTICIKCSHLEHSNLLFMIAILPYVICTCSFAISYFRVLCNSRRVLV